MGCDLVRAWITSQEMRLRSLFPSLQQPSWRQRLSVLPCMVRRGYALQEMAKERMRTFAIVAHVDAGQ